MGFGSVAETGEGGMSGTALLEPVCRGSRSGMWWPVSEAKVDSVLGNVGRVEQGQLLA